MKNSKKVLKEQNRYAAMMGGFLGIRETDDRYNGLNRKFIEAFKAENPEAVIGKINGDGNDGVFRDIGEGRLFNFCCDFIIPAPDTKLEKLIMAYRNGSSRILDKIQDRISEAGGQPVLWY